MVVKDNEIKRLLQTQANLEQQCEKLRVILAEHQKAEEEETKDLAVLKKDIKSNPIMEDGYDKKKRMELK